MAIYQSFVKSVKGRRENNQDSCIVLSPSDDSAFVAVADGMGGVQGGEIASKAVIDSCKKVLKETFAKELKPNQLKEVLLKIFIRAQVEIRKKIQEDPGLTGMGTTLACALILKDSYVWGSLGDSRIYFLSDDRLSLITKDHTYIQDYLDKNIDKPVPETVLKNYSNFLTRTIDGGQDEPDIFPDVLPYEKLPKNSILMICSDGLILDKSINSESIFYTSIVGSKTLDEAGEKLVKTAFDNGSTDNITVVLIEYGAVKRKKIPPPKLISSANLASKNNNKARNFGAKITGLLSLIVFGLIVIMVWVKPELFNEKQEAVERKVKQIDEEQIFSNKLDEKKSNNSSEEDSNIDDNGPTGKDQKNDNEPQLDSTDSTVQPEKKLVKIPGLKGLKLSQAKKSLKKSGLQFKLEENSPDDESSVVESVNPTSGTKVPNDKIVLLRTKKIDKSK